MLLETTRSARMRPRPKILSRDHIGLDTLTSLGSGSGRVLTSTYAIAGTRRAYACAVDTLKIHGYRQQQQPSSRHDDLWHTIVMSQQMRRHYIIVNRVTLCNFHDYNKLTVTLITANNSFTVESQIITSAQKCTFCPPSGRDSYRPLGLRTCMPTCQAMELHRGYCNGAKHIRQEARLRKVFSFHGHSCRSWSMGDKPEWIPVLTPYSQQPTSCSYTELALHSCAAVKLSG